MQIVQASIGDAAILTQISKAAFDTDVDFGNPYAGGPPCYDSEDWHVTMCESLQLYKIIENDAIIGGAILLPDDNDKTALYVGRVFIAPAQHHNGYGIMAMKMIEDMFPQYAKFKLDTPIWNVRTSSFYPKAGYTEVSRDKHFIYYEKVR